MLHDEHRDVDDVVAFLQRWLLVNEARARQALRFLSSPLWRAYTSTYVEGYRLLRGWLDARPADVTLGAAVRPAARRAADPVEPADLIDGASDASMPPSTTRDPRRWLLTVVPQPD